MQKIVDHLDNKPSPEESFEMRLRRILTGRRVLEVGSNNGVFLKFLREHGADVVGIEPQTELADFARQYSNAHVICDYAEKVLGLKPFDLIISKDVYDVNPSNVPQRLNELHAMLKSGGFAIHERTITYPLDTRALLEVEVREHKVSGLNFFTVVKKKDKIGAVELYSAFCCTCRDIRLLAAGFPPCTCKTFPKGAFHPLRTLKRSHGGS